MPAKTTSHSQIPGSAVGETFVTWGATLYRLTSFNLTPPQLLLEGHSLVIWLVSPHSHQATLMHEWASLLGGP